MGCKPFPYWKKYRIFFAPPPNKSAAENNNLTKSENNKSPLTFLFAQDAHLIGYGRGGRR